MRKTSQDGTDSTSVASGLDNDLKKPGTTTNKIKKSSIKRKVPNFSHDSDDAIIEPLLQTEKENSVIANKSAKYLLNKSKTDCLYEKDTNALENPKVSTPLGIANNITNNVISEKQTSPSFISETGPINNHMNTNVFRGYDLKKEKTTTTTTTSNSILVEIDGCKTVSHGPSPLIFTTAKIHTDSKTKIMEPFQVTPMPILSTIEGNIVKAGVIYEEDKRLNVSNTNKNDVNKNVGNKSDLKLQPSNFNNLAHVKLLPSEKISNSIEIKNQQNIKQESDAKGSLKDTSKSFSKESKVSLKTSNGSDVVSISSIPKVTSDNTVLTVTSKQILPTSTTKANGSFVSDASKQSIGNEANNIHISKVLSDNENINSNKLSQPCSNASKQNNKSNINTTQNDKSDSIKISSNPSKKLQRQKNAAVEELKEINYKELNNVTSDKSSAVLDKVVSAPLNIKSDNASVTKTTAPMTTVTAKGTTPIVTTGIASKSSNTATNPSACKTAVTKGTSALISGKSNTETAKTKPAPTKIPEPSIKSATKSPANTSAMATTTTSKTSTTATAKGAKVTDKLSNKSSDKQDSSSVSVLPSKIIKNETTSSSSVVTSSVASALPLYIVSTSKTKIGSSLTPSLSTVTKKTPDQKPVTEIVHANGKSGKLSMSTSSSQNNQSSSKPKITNINLVKKD